MTSKRSFRFNLANLYDRSQDGNGENLKEYEDKIFMWMMGMFNIVFKCLYNNNGYTAKCNGCPPGINVSCLRGTQGRCNVNPEREDSCWEKDLFNTWRFGSGDNKGIARDVVNKLVFYTTKKPGSYHRSLIGVTKVIEKERETSDGWWADIIVGDPNLGVIIPFDVNFEKWYRKDWRQGLFRYISNDTARETIKNLKLEFRRKGMNSGVQSRLDTLLNIVLP